MENSILYSLIWVVVLFVGLRFWRLRFGQNEPNLGFEYAFLVKSAVGFLFIYLYAHFYPSSDAFAYLKDSRILHGVFYKSPVDYFKFLTGWNQSPEIIQQYLQDTKLWSRGDGNLINDSQNVIRINSLLFFISCGNAYIHAIFMGLISLFGMRHLVLAFQQRIQLKSSLFFWGMLALPNLLFWSAGILKEPFLILGLGLIARALLGELSTKRKTIFLISGILLLVCFKPYVLICLLFALFFAIWSRSVYRHIPIFSFCSFLLLCVGLVLLFPNLRQKFTDDLSVKQIDSIHVGEGGLYAMKDSNQFYFFYNAHLNRLRVKDSVIELLEPTDAKQKWIYRKNDFKPIHLEPKGEKWKLYVVEDSSVSLIPIQRIDHSFSNLVTSAPQAIANALLRPFWWDNGGAMKYPSALEVFGVLGFLILAIVKRRKLNVEEQKLIFALILFSISILALVGWTTPVAGAIVRYRIPAYIAIFVLSIFIISIPEKWKQQTT